MLTRLFLSHQIHIKPCFLLCNVVRTSHKPALTLTPFFNVYYRIHAVCMSNNGYVLYDDDVDDDHDRLAWINAH